MKKFDYFPRGPENNTLSIFLVMYCGPFHFITPPPPPMEDVNQNLPPNCIGQFMEKNVALFCSQLALRLVSFLPSGPVRVAGQ